jgi:hypothetical protein
MPPRIVSALVVHFPASTQTKMSRNPEHASLDEYRHMTDRQIELAAEFLLRQVDERHARVVDRVDSAHLRVIEKMEVLDSDIRNALREQQAAMAGLGSPRKGSARPMASAPLLSGRGLSSRFALAPMSDRMEIRNDRMSTGNAGDSLAQMMKDDRRLPTIPDVPERNGRNDIAEFHPEANGAPLTRPPAPLPARLPAPQRESKSDAHMRARSVPAASYASTPLSGMSSLSTSPGPAEARYNPPARLPGPEPNRRGVQLPLGDVHRQPPPSLAGPPQPNANPPGRTREAHIIDNHLADLWSRVTVPL